MSVWSIVALVGGLVVLVVGAEVLVRGASRLAVGLGISPLVVGLTVVAFGTSAPEVAVGVQAALNDSTELALGNVAGSNMFNTLFILGLSALIVPLLVRQKLVRREMFLVLGASVLVLVFALGGVITRWQGALLLAGAVAYTVWAVRTERAEPPEVVAEYVEGVPGRGNVPTGARHRVVEVAMVVVGLVGLVVGARWLVAGAVDLAVSLGLSQLVVGVVIVAIGTSAPEVATSVVAAVRGERDIAVGNVVGSNLFNLLVVLGATAAVAPSGIPVPDPAGPVLFQLVALVGVAAISLGIFYSHLAVRRWEGAALFVLYGVYVAYSLAAPGGGGALRTVQVAGGVIVGVVVVAVVVEVVRSWRSPVPGAPLVAGGERSSGGGGPTDGSTGH